MEAAKKRNPYLIAFCLALALAFFVIDISIPLGVAGGVPYVAVVLVSLWAPRRNFVIYTAVFCSLLVVSGYFISPPGGVLWKVLSNRFLALFAVWVTTLLGMELKRSEREVSKLNVHLKHHADKLEVANRELESFSYSVSHDLRTPLRAIDGFSRMLLEDYADKFDDEGKRLLKVVRGNTKKMGQLIDDILAFSRMGRKKLSISEINMEKLTTAVSEELKGAYDGCSVHLEISALPPAKGDPAMFRQVIVNLLGNSIKFTMGKRDAKIEVGGRSDELENVYYVKDNGAGFDMKYAHKLFGVFQRLHGDEFEGTGIGLAIVHRIITRHGGRVWAEGKVNEGATFYFALPRGGGKLWMARTG